MDFFKNGTGWCQRHNPNKKKATSVRSHAPIFRQQAHKRSSNPTHSASPQAKGSSLSPKSTSSKILEPGYKRTSLGSGDPATRTNEFFGCFTKKAIWWGEKRILLTFVNFSSTRKKFPKLLYPNISGVPNKALFSSLVQLILLLHLLSSRHKSFSNFTG